MQPLSALIEQLEKGRNLHISILDLNGILTTPLTKIDFAHMVHSKKFCDIAKETARGYKSCLRCKTLANEKAVSGRSAFFGQCIYGLTEASVPVIKGDCVMAVVYVGNAIVDFERARERIKRTCRYTRASEEALCSALSRCELVKSEKELLAIGEIVADYLKMLLDAAPVQNGKNRWIVSLMKRYAKEGECGAVSLREFAVSHQKNARYIGRIFKNEVGMSFGDYCHTVWLEMAANRLRNENERIIEVALGCGFQNVSYFNRLFRKKVRTFTERLPKKQKIKYGLSLIMAQP